MKIFLLSIFSFLVIINSYGQPSYSIDINEAVGSGWGVGIIGADSLGMLPNPETGADQVWDFSFLGSEDNGAGVLFSDATSVDDYIFQITFVDLNELATPGGGTVQDSFPDGIGSLLVANSFSDEISGPVLGQENDDVIRFGQVTGTNDVFQTELSEKALLEYNFPDNLGETIVQNDTINFFNSDNNTIQTTVYIDTITYLGYGTINMFYGDVDDVIMLRENNSTTVITSDMDGNTLSVSTSTTDDFSFYQSQNLLQILQFIPFDDGPTLLVSVPFFTVPSSTNDIAQIPIQMRVSPNPIINQGEISFKLERPGSVDLELITVGGKSVLHNNLGKLGTESQKVSFTLPDNLSTGMYIMKLTTSNGETGVTNLMINK